MELGQYIDKVVREKKAIFCRLIIEKDFVWNNLIFLCDLTLPKECLIIAWSLIIDTISEIYTNEKMISFIPERVLDFLIENNICLIDLAHLRLPPNYLQKIYRQDNSCWEALKTLEDYNNAKD